MHKTALVVPCRNEAARLRPDLFREHLGRDHETSFLFVDDGSTDGTGALLQALQAETPSRIEALRHDGGGGKAAAVRLGFLHAFRGGFDSVGYWDADLSTPLDVLTAMRGLLAGEGARAVLGSRVRLLGRAIERGAARHYAGRVYATAASLALGLPVYDTQCGAKLFARDGDLEAVFRPPFTVGWTFDVEIIARYAALARLRGESGPPKGLVEFPVPSWRDVPGSKVRARDFPVALWEIAHLAVLYRGPGSLARCARLLDIPPGRTAPPGNTRGGAS